jgi:hypothetical protein
MLGLFIVGALLLAQTGKLQNGDWPMYNHDFAGSRYSPLTQINTTNVAKLKQVCRIVCNLRTSAMPRPAPPPRSFPLS